MAVTMLSNLYPPQFPSTFAPAFPTTASPRIYFSISEYNSSNDIRRVHVSIVNQSNSESAVNNSTGILFKDLNYDTEAGMYYVDISVTEIRSTKTENTLDSTGHVIQTVDTTSGWNYNQYYKLQLRFDNNEDNVVNNSDYFVTYLENFSEWSQVLLLRPIVQPEILVRPFDLTEDSSQVLAVNKGILHLSGLLQFGDGRTGETETMQNYKVEVLNINNDTVLYSSDTIYTNNSVDPNAIDYLLDLAGLDTTETNTFRVRVTITTKNNYTTYKDYEFAIADYVTEDAFNPTVTVDVDKENGIATLHIENTQTVFGTLYVRRSSSVSNFKEWEALREQTIAGPIDLDIVDNTIGSGIWYRYYCQLENTVGGLTRLYYSEKFFPDFYDAIFSREDRQIAVRFNYNISNMKPVVNRQKIDTLGGRYPKFVENAAMNYKQFSISGLISTQEDENEMFLGKEDYFGEEYDNYTIYEEGEYRDQYTIENYNYFWERGFREELVKWLNDGEPKLYRSMTEGLMVVMLTDISLTPNKTLSRRLYDFSATVYEIADGNSLETLNTLGIYKMITLDNQTGGGGGGTGPDPQPEYVDVAIPGQLYEESISNIVSGKVDIVSNVILSRLQEKYSGVREDKMPRDLYIRYVKIQFLNKPHLFLQNNSGIYLVDDPNAYSESDRQKMQLGYTFEVNNQSTNPNSSSIFFVNRKGYYAIPDNIDVTSLFFPQTDDVVLLEYVAFYKEANNSSTQVSTTTVERTVVGQERGVFAAGEYLGEKIRKKYSYVVPGSFYQQMQRWKGICLDVTPFAVANILYDGETDYVQAVVGMTGVLHLLENCVVQDLYFSGRRMNKIDISDLPYAKDYEFAISDTSYENVSDISNPQIQMVYKVKDKYYIYYNDYSFYEFTFEEDSSTVGIAAVNIEGDINYYGDVQRFTYA